MGLAGCLDERTVPAGGKDMDAVMLAAGNSTRFGENKLLCLLDGKPVYRYMLKLLYRKQNQHKIRHLIVVSQYGEILADVREHFPGVQAVCNPEPEKGISGSIRLGLSCLMQLAGNAQAAPDAVSGMQPCGHGDACLFAVADQPGFSESSFDKMLDFWERHPYGIVAAGLAAQPGQDAQMKNPVIFSSEHYPQLLALSGDCGGKQVIRRHMEDAGLCPLPAAELEDLDTRQALERFEHRLAFLRMFPFLKEKGHVIALTGAGGKTTFMETLASYYAGMGNKVIMTTTTHILRPARYPAAENPARLKQLLEKHWIVAAGSDAPQGKLRMSDNMQLSDYRKAADVVLIEADGAKHFPCKVPLETEPVIPDECDTVIGVAGMDALGQPLCDACFRKEKAAKLLGTGEGHRITGKDLAAILYSEHGTRKGTAGRDYYIVLNKCDNEIIRARAQHIRELLLQKGAQHVACISCKPGSMYCK